MYNRMLNQAIIIPAAKLISLWQTSDNWKLKDIRTHLTNIDYE